MTTIYTSGCWGTYKGQSYSVTVVVKAPDGTPVKGAGLLERLPEPGEEARVREYTDANGECTLILVAYPPDFADKDSLRRSLWVGAQGFETQEVVVTLPKADQSQQSSVSLRVEVRLRSADKAAPE